ncbi:MAG: hypothetical protein JNM26_03070 [Ideonella sp.]|nr:hypothetical protein [Ideonella sp.]
MTTRRRLVGWLAAVGAGALGACDSTPVRPDDTPRRPGVFAGSRSVAGGFLVPPGSPFGALARPGTGAYVKLQAPAALALRGNDLAVADLATGRLWRVDLALGTLSPIPGAPVSPQTRLALGPDLSVWLLDTAARQVLRFARDGRLMQTWRGGPDAPSPVGLALADGGATLLVADASTRQWLELRGAGGRALAVAPGGRDPAQLRGVDDIAVAGDRVLLLDRLAGVVHVLQRDGRGLDRLGEGQLAQPVAIAADRAGRIAVLDGQDGSLKWLTSGRPARVIDAQALGVQQPAGIALDEGWLAVSDRLAGQVLIHRLPAEAAP